jgi:hypothetical protein
MPCQERFPSNDWPIHLSLPRRFFCKRQEWSNEEEVRLVLQRGKGSKVKVDPRWLTRVILGKDMTSGNEELIREWAQQREPELAVVRAPTMNFINELDSTFRKRLEFRARVRSGNFSNRVSRQRRCLDGCRRLGLCHS